MAPPNRVACPLKMRCPSCGITVRGKAELFARQVTCPKCRAQGVFVPAEERKRGDTQEFPPAPGSRLLGRWIGSRQAWLIAGVAAAALAVLVGYLALAKSSPEDLFEQWQQEVRTVSPPLASMGKVPSKENLAPYGSIRSAGAIPRPLAKAAQGLLLYYDHQTKFPDVLAAAQVNPSAGGQAPGPCPRVAVMVSPTERWRPDLNEEKFLAGKKPRGPKVVLLLLMFALPEITTQEKGAPAGVDTRMDTLVIRVARLGARGCRFRVRAFETADANHLAVILAQIMSSTQNFPVRIVPKDDVTLSDVVTTVEACLRAKIALDRITLDPTEALGGTVQESPGEKLKRDIFKKKPDAAVEKTVDHPGVPHNLPESDHFETDDKMDKRGATGKQGPL